MNDFISVSEFAKMHGKDPGNIRRLLAAGRMDGQKVGNQWIIPKNTSYPIDKREKSGQYRNQRKITKLNGNKELMSTVHAMIKKLCEMYGELISQVILYGSYARGTQTGESDVDIALLLKKKPSKSISDKMIDCVSSFELECGKVLSVIDIDENMFNSWKNTLPFYKNIQKEGIVLWKSET